MGQIKNIKLHIVTDIKVPNTYQTKVYKMPNIHLKSSDDEVFEVDVEIAKASMTIKTMLEDLGMDDDDEDRDKRTDDIDPWDQEFLKVDQGTLFELILAANYLDIKGLLDVCCKTVANMIKGKTPEEIRKTFNIKNDFTPEEEEQVRKENEWCEDK